MFVQPKDKAREIWDGPRLGVDAAKHRFGAVRVFESSRVEEELPKLLVGHQRIYSRLGERAEDEQRILRALRQARRLARRAKIAPTEIVDAAVLIHEMRRLKSKPSSSTCATAAAITEEGPPLGHGFRQTGRQRIRGRGVVAARVSRTRR